MRTISVVGVKGGTAKTSSALLLAFAASATGETVYVADSDPQRSATKWVDEVLDEGGTVPFTLDERTTARRLADLPDEYSLRIVDTPPGDLKIARSAVGASDLAVVPMSPSRIELEQMAETFDLVLGLGVEPVVLVVRARSNTKALGELVKGLADAEIAHLSAAVPLRQGVVESFGTVPGAGLLTEWGYSPAWAEMDQRWNELTRSR